MHIIAPLWPVASLVAAEAAPFEACRIALASADVTPDRIYRTLLAITGGAPHHQLWGASARWNEAQWMTLTL